MTRNTAVLAVIAAVAVAGCMTSTDSELIQAAKEGNTQAVQKLIHAGQDINPTCTLNQYVDHDEQMNSAMKGVPAKNVYITEGSPTPLVAAAFAGRTESVRALINAGANINAKCPQAFRLLATPLHAAISTGRAQIVEMLVAAGADVNAGTDFDQSTPLHVVTSGGQRPRVVNGTYSGTMEVSKEEWRESKERIVRALIAAGTDVNARDRNGETALHHSTLAEESIVKALIAAGADVNARDKRGYTALRSISYKSSNRAIQTAKILIAAGADPNITDNRRNAKNAYDSANDPEMKRILASAGGEQSASQRAYLKRKKEEKEEDRRIAKRNALIDRLEGQMAAGVISYEEAQRRVRAFDEGREARPQSTREPQTVPRTTSRTADGKSCKFFCGGYPP